MKAGSTLRLAVALGVALTGMAAPVLRAAERITLANGFELSCDHHALVDGRVRIYALAGAADYMEVSADSVRAVEWAPDPEPVVSAATVTEGTNIEATKPVVAAAPAVAEKLTAEDLHEMLSRAGARRNVDADLLASLVKAESNGNPRAVSRVGARGLMQLMPRTAKDLGVEDSFQPEENVRGGTAYFDGLLTRFHNNIALAVAAYNAGPEAVERYHGVPPYRETRAYVARVIHEFNRRVAARRSLTVMTANNGSRVEMRRGVGAQ